MVSHALAINPCNFWFWFGGIWLGVGLLFVLLGVFFAWNELTLESRLARAGQRAQGIVLVKSWGDGSDSRHPNLRVQYRFTTTAGKTVHSNATVSEPAWEAMREREAVSVTYLPDSPRTNRIDGRVVQWVMPVVFCGETSGSNPTKIHRRSACAPRGGRRPWRAAILKRPLTALDAAALAQAT